MQKAETQSRAAESKRQRAAFGQAIYELRMARKLSQEELGFESELDRSYISILERGGKEPCLGALFKLAKALNTSVSELFQAVERIHKEGPKPKTKNPRVR